MKTIGNAAEKQTHIQKAHVSRQSEISPMSQRLIIEISSHVMGNTNDESSKIFEVAVKRGRFFEELEFYHVAIVTV